MKLSEGIERIYREKWSFNSSGHLQYAQMQRILCILGDLTLSSITPTTLAVIATELHKEGIGAATINNYLVNMKTLLRAAHERWAIIDALVKPEKLKVKKMRRETFLTPSQFSGFLELLKDTPLIVEALEVLYCTGMRISELLNLVPERDCDFIKGMINITDTKSGRSRVIYMVKKVALILVKYPQGFPLKAWQVNRAFNKAKAQSHYKNTDLVVHSLRHSTAYNLLSQGCSLYTTSKWLGHASVKTTEDYYAHFCQEYFKPALGALEQCY